MSFVERLHCCCVAVIVCCEAASFFGSTFVAVGFWCGFDAGATVGAFVTDILTVFLV